MGGIGTKLRRASSADGKDVQLMHWCPGCDQPHGIRIEGGPPIWSFNGDYENPHFNPSIRCFTTHTTDDDDKPLPSPVQETLCHYHIHHGKIEFCSDSPHALSGQTVALPDWPYAPGSYGGIED